MKETIPVEFGTETFERGPLPKVIKGRKIRVEPRNDGRVKLVCNECGKKRLISPDGNYNDRCPKCGGVDWGVL